MEDAHAITCPGALENLPTLLAFLDREAAAAAIDEEAAFALRLAVEEACTNVIQHGYGAGRGAPGPIRLAVRADRGRATVELTDEAPVFDPADAPPPDLDSDWEARRIGGLGWHLVYQLMDEVRHEAPPGGGNRVTLVKYVSPPTP